MSVPGNGIIRVGINTANPFLVSKTGNGDLSGVAIDLAAEIAGSLNLEFRSVPYESAGSLFDAVDRDEWDIAFLAIESSRAQKAAFTKPYAHIEGAFLVKDAAPFRANEDVDAPNVKIAVGKNAAYDLHLSRVLKNASLLRGNGPAQALQFLLAGEADVAAGVRKSLEAVAKQHNGLRILPGSFMTIPQGIAVPISKAAGVVYLQEILDLAALSGQLNRILERHA